MRLRPLSQILLFLIAACLWWATPAQAQVRRCTGANGGTIFTDRRCVDVGATERVPHVAASDHAARFYRGGCARNLQDLIYEVTSAIDNRDVNQLAGVYHWVGMSSSTGYAVMSRLDAIAQRPLVDVAPVFPATPGDDSGDYYPQATVRRAPVGLRLEQTLGASATPSRTVLGLRHYLGCWWISL
jgi:hypothetical protein